MRICSLLPAATEIAYALGLGKHVVGVTHECDYPQEARARPIVVRSALDPEGMTSAQIDRAVSRARRSLYRIDFDAFRMISPDLILTQELCDVCAVDRTEVVEACTLLAREPTIISLGAVSLGSVLADIERVGKATGTDIRARELTWKLRDRIERVSRRAAGSRSKPRVACLEWLEPLYYGGHWIPEMIELAGGKVGFGRVGEPSARLEWDALVDFAPEILLLMPCGFDAERTKRELHLLTTRAGWSELPAVKAGRVFAVDARSYFSRPGPRLADGLELMAQLIHPEFFPEPVVASAAFKIG
ncbi:MAG TPA: cobalamin-binding protein [Candidatus Eisenbacteria bacterium]|nr:cobalamin-binding protein [Candidatus Eisenbacteria bacterium]